jgi:hypothetical protein
MMTKLTSGAAMAFLSGCLALGIGGPAFAETAAPAPAHQPPGHEPPLHAPSGPEEAEDGDHVAPVMQVTSVEVLRSTHGPELDIIRARGLTSTEGWEQAELVPLTEGPPSDGILDLVFVARPPSGGAAATGFAPIEAIFPIEPGHPFKGVRVHAASNPVTVKELPGFAEGPPAPESCAKCVGKYFVPKGGALPAGKTEADVVKEEHLPSSLRVIKPTDGIGKLESDPNRLTLVVGEDGRIVGVVWD